MRRAWGGVVGALVLACLPQLASAQGIDACEASARAVLEASGGRVAAGERAFLLERESHVVTHRLDRAGCVAFLAFGGAGVRDVDLLAHTARGDVIEEDVEPRAWGWARACGEAGAEIAVVAHVFAGRGELRVLAIEGAAETAPELGRSVGACFAGSAGRGRPLTDPGAAPDARSLDRAIESADARALGWRADGAPERGWLDPGATEIHRLSLAGGTCHRVEAIGGPEVRALGLVLIAPDGREMDRDERARREAAVVVCPREPGGWIAQVRARSGAGAYALRHRVLEGAPLDAARADDRAAVESVALAAALAARGMAARPVAWGVADGRGSQAFVVDAPEGCVAISALRASEIGEGDLDVRVEDERGLLASWDEGPPSVDRGEIPIAWSCGAARALRVEVRAHQGRGRFLLVLGTPPGEPR